MSAWANVRYDYRGAAVLVTGGTSGIGAGIAAAYQDAGAEVTITGTRPSVRDYEGTSSAYPLPAAEPHRQGADRRASRRRCRGSISW